MNGFFMLVLFVVIMAYSIIAFYAGYLGIEYHLSTGWAIGAIFAAFIFRFTLPITVGAFFGAMDVWGWHWVWSLLFAAPGIAFLLLMIPGALASIFQRRHF